jgi:gliding motility-associated-like protein
MRNVILITSLFFLFLPATRSQNLVPDPGFEIWNGTTGSPPNTLSPLTHWYNANGTADHHHQQNPPGSNLTSLLPCPTGNGNTECGEPYEGMGVLGCWKANGSDGTREWGATRLTEPLVPGACYRVSFWVQNKEDHPDFFMATSQWGLFFSETEYPSFTANLANYAPMSDLWLACDSMISENEWQYFEWIYNATEASEYMFVGYMGDFSTSTYTAWSNNFFIGFYVWFDEITVERINPTLAVPEDLAICPGDSTLLEFTSNYPILWTDGTTIDSSTSIWVKPTQATTYYIQTQDSTDCSVLDSVTVSLIIGPQNTFNELVCAPGDPFELSSGGISGSWSGPGITNPDIGLFDPTATGPGTFEVFFEAALDCSQSFSLLIEVQEPPELIFSVDPTSGCAPLSVSFMNELILPGAEYTWDFGTGDFNFSATPPPYVYDQAGTYDVSLSVQLAEKCKYSETISDAVRVQDYPIAAFDFTPENPSNLDPVVQFVLDPPNQPTTWLWNFGDGTSSSSLNPTHHYLAPGDYVVSLYLETTLGCADSSTQLVQVENLTRVYVPNIFSPNDDGRNDFFEIGTFGQIDNYHLIIYDRWGSLVFESRNPSDAWDGTIGNKSAPEGVYIYILEYEFVDLLGNPSNAVRKSGDITLLR